MRSAKSKYFSDLIEKNCHSPRILFKTINAAVNPSVGLYPTSSLFMCDTFLTFFVDKIRDIRLNIVPSLYDPSVPPICTSILYQFEPVTLPFLQDIVGQLKPSGSALDVLPPKFFKDIFEVIGSNVQMIMNNCIVNGFVPEEMKHAIIHPLLKKPNLDPTVLSNCRPVSTLSFMSKILEKIVFHQLQSFLNGNKIFEAFQSGFRKYHSTETALVKVLNDILLIAGKSMVLVLLDLSAAFDTVDHAVLISRLEHCAGIRGNALKWFQSYLYNRSFSVNIGEFMTGAAPLTCGVPQGSILAPVLFSLYMLPLRSIFKKHNISFHCYADDTQIYLPLESEKRGMDNLLACLADVKAWMSVNFLHLNENKTEIIVFESSDAFSSSCLDFGLLSPFVKPLVKNLGVFFDSSLKFDKQISSVVKTSFFHLRVLAKVKPFFSFKDFEKVIHAFVSTRLDYCNSIYMGINQSSLARLQMVQNAAARLLTGVRKREHITPVLISLHWLPVHFRIDFKVLLLVFKCLNGLAPEYLSDLLSIHNPVRSLRSSNQRQLNVPWARLKLRGDRAFSIAAPKPWNSLPVYIRTASMVHDFKGKLKTYLFSLASS